MKEKEKSCHECIHCRVCYLYLTMTDNINRGKFSVFFKDYKFSSFANICDNYKKGSE
ncbi:MAG: hypothetical protein ACFFDX_16395 [Candidatus Odinarchaeota archaeon]